MRKKFKIGFLQFKPFHKDIDTNLSLIEKYKSKIEKSDLIVLPELATTGYVFESKNELLPLAENLPEGPQSNFFFNLARSTNTLIITGIAERDGSNIFNTQAVFYPDGRFEKYRKIHLFFKEKNIFDTAYNEPKVIEYSGIKIGLMICFDWIFPEHSRLLMIKGAHILAHSANLVLPGLGQAGMRVRSIENRVFSITANRFGEEKGVKFTGKSQIISPKGEVLAQAKEEEEILKVVEIDPLYAENKEITPLNDIKKDRRVELYRSICDDRA